MRLFVTTTFFIALIILCDRNIAQGSLIKKDVSQYPIHISAGSIITWQKDEIRVFQAKGNVEIEQGDVRITANGVIIWFKEVKIGQLVEGNMEIYCGGNVTLFQEENIQDFEETYLELVTTAGVAISPKRAHVQVKSFEDEQRSELYVQAEKFKAKEKGESYKDDTPTGTAAAGGMVDILADDIDTWLENDVRIIVAIGNVRIKKGDETLNADNVILYFDQEEGEKDKSPKQIYKEVYAEGNITLKRKDDLVIAEKIFENFKENKGIFVNSTISRVIKPPVVKVPIPTYIKGDEIKHSEGNYEIKNGDFSLCSYGHPHYRFKYSKLRIVKTGERSILTSKNNVFYVGKVPLMYLPSLSFNLKQNTKRLEEWNTGRTSRFGRFVTTDWDVYGFAFGEKMDDWSDLTLSADFLELRGPAAGLDFEYAKSNYFGYASTYYINDDEDFDINNVPVPQEDRGHFLWRHRQTFFDDWIADIEISHVSDRSFFREYFQQDFKLNKDRTTLLYLRNLSGNRGITFLAEHQLRTYDTLIDSVRLSRKNESFPELKYRIIGEPLWDGKLNFTSETELVYQNRLFDRIPPLKSETNFLGRGALLTAERVFDRTPTRFAPEETIRFDTNSTLNAPFRLWSQRFNPFIGIRLTGYSESVKEDPVTQENEGGGTPRGRIAIPIGINTSTTLSRTYSVYNKFLNINRLRHIMVPGLSLNFIPVVTQNPEDLNQFDGIDAIDTYQAITLGLRNRLQTKRGEPGKEKTVDIVDFNTEFNFFPGNAGLNRKRDNFVELYLKVKLTDRISFLSEGNEFNLSKGGFDILNTDLRYTTPKLKLSIGNRFVDNISSTIKFSANVSLSEKWNVAFLEQYAFRTEQKDEIGRGTDFESQSLYTSATITRYFHDWIARMSISQISTRADDNIVRFDILPRGVGVTTTRLRSLGLLLPQEE
jgi:lipopolysaccharide assembly outer membrane protein LptD (OstA)